MQVKLHHLLSTTESSHVERTTSTDNMDKFCQVIVPFPTMFREVARTAT